MTTPSAESSGTRTLGQLALTAVNLGLLKTHTMLPGQITAVKTNNRVDVQPLIKTLLPGASSTVSLPILQDVLVSAPRGDNYGIKLPYAVGDTGSLIFSERSLDVWSVEGGLVDPLDTRHHDLSDAVFVPGLYPFSQPIPVPMGSNPEDLVIYNGIAQIYLEKLGQFKITNGVEGVELLTIVNQILDYFTGTVAFLTAGSVAAAPGGVPGAVALAAVFASAVVPTVPPTTLSAMLLDLAAIKLKLTQLVEV